MDDQISYIMEKLAKLELQVHYLEESAVGEHIIVDFKRLTESAKKPTKANEADAGWDLYSDEDVYLPYGTIVKVKTGIAFDMPDYNHGFIWDRSSMGAKGIHVLGGMIDSPYRGEIQIILTNLKMGEPYMIKKGDKITQIVFVKLPKSHMRETASLSESERGDRGFGSSGAS